MALEQYGEVFAPDIDYSIKYVQPVEILKRYPSTEFNVLIGSSMGALNAYIISDNIGRPVLLFNPPLSKYKAVTFNAHFTKGLASKQILLGGKDEVVDPSKTLSFLTKHLKESELEIIFYINQFYLLSPAQAEIKRSRKCKRLILNNLFLNVIPKKQVFLSQYLNLGYCFHRQPL